MSHNAVPTLAAIAFVLPLAACGSGAATSPTTPSASSSAPTASPAPSRFATPNAIVTAVNADGAGCTGYLDAPSNTGVAYSTATGTCTINGTIVRFHIFATDSEQSTFVATTKRGAAITGCLSTTNADGTQNPILIVEGANWVVESDDDQITQRLAQDLHTHTVSLCA